MTKTLRVYGDNIVECERTLNIICISLGLETAPHHLEGSLAIPSIIVNDDLGNQLKFILVAGYGDNRWAIDVLKLLEKSGGLLREAPDSLVTEIKDGVETLLFAIEYCGALPAGNQAWQRNGRALSFAYSKIPYFYLTELGGFELDKERSRKAERLPNPLIPFSYLSISIEQRTPVLPVYIPSPGTSNNTNKKYQSIYGTNDLYQYIDACLNNKNTDLIIEALHNKTIKLVQILAENRSRDDSLNVQQWEELYAQANLKKAGIGNCIIGNYAMKWSKKVSIPTTQTFDKLLKVSENLNSGVTSSNLPISILPESDRSEFSALIKSLYSHSGNQKFVDWIESGKGPLAIAWIAGFKPRGDDARPDRGLAPLLRMTVGNDCDVMAIVYGPAPEHQVKLLESDRDLLGRRNGLWESIIKTCDAILVDSINMFGVSISQVLTNRQNYVLKAKESTIVSELKILKFGEQDVDTSIHILFSKLLSGKVFEGLCNPPGGDWSGISLLSANLNKEYRWLTLPRVTQPNQKRPDHIFQIFDGKKLIIICESKDKIKDIETGIGPRLKKYVTELTKVVSDIERSQASSEWLHSNEHFDFSDFEFVTIAAGIVNERSNIAEIATRGEVDLVMGFNFTENGSHKIQLYALTDNGKLVRDSLANIKTALGASVVSIEL